MLSALIQSRLRYPAVRLAGARDPGRPIPLTFACTRTIADYVAPRIVAAHLGLHPDGPVAMRAGNTRDLVRALDHGEIDFALVEGSFDRERFASEVLSREPYIAVAGPGPAADVRPASIHDLLERRLILREAGSGTREILEKHLAARDLAIDDFASAVELESIPTIKACVKRRLILREAGSGTREILEKHLAARDLAIDDFASAVELESIPTIKACVKEGAGITFLYRAAVQRELERRELIDITPRDFTVEHDFCLIWQRGSQYGARYRALCEAWRQLLP